MLKTKDFHLKQFSIMGNQAGMAVSTDGILLGAWADIDQAQHILDIGTGTGLLALMSAQRTSESLITAVDIDEQAIIAAKDNIQRSPWSARIKLIHHDIQALQLTTPVSHIICNPPYFNSGHASQHHARSIARHTLTLSHQALLDACQQHLAENGLANFILPTDEGNQFIQLAQTKGWHLDKLCEVKTTPNKAVSRLLFTLSKRASSTQHQTLTIQNQGQYSPEFIQLTQAFYLKM